MMIMTTVNVILTIIIVTSKMITTVIITIKRIIKKVIIVMIDGFVVMKFYFQIGFIAMILSSYILISLLLFYCCSSCHYCYCYYVYCY
jgi:hypothetical protein